MTQRPWRLPFAIKPTCTEPLRADRDIVSAGLAARVELADAGDPRTARVDYRLAHALREGLASRQEWDGSVNRHQPPPLDAGSARTGSHHRLASAAAEQAAPPPEQTTPPNVDVADENC
ncbi:hypothetical protein [Mycobacterium intracellulare]|uniref:hypothetical protein n=1 Tax=Mycobacterium intracellulare TaxID=1767 RepID=UPI000B099B3E|nr:hypothetical protein [Mycobacterium intracellulare]